MAKLQKSDDIEEDALAAKRTFDARWTESHLQKRGELKQLFDFMFLDGDHTARGVRQDYLDYRSLVTPNGFIAFHDIAADPEKSGNIDKNGPIEVAKVWHEIKCHPRSGNTWEFVDVGSDYGIGVVDNAECYLLGEND